MGEVAIPVARIDGGLPGPTWILSAGVHGDEYEGPAAIRRAVASLAGSPFTGRVIALPVANPFAYAAGVRCTPADGGNLNRAFPGRDDGPLTARWAYHLWNEFFSRADRLVDLHAGGAFWKFETVAGYYRDEDRPLAAALGLTLWRPPPTPGVLSYEFLQRRGPAIGAELGFGGVRDEAVVDRLAPALVAIVRGQIVPDPVPAQPAYSHIEVVAPADGEWTAACDIRHNVGQDKPLGRIEDWTGQTIASVTSPVAGRVLCVRRLVSVRKGDLLAVIGQPT